MKTSMRWLSVAGLAVLAIVLFATCSDPTEDEVTPKEEEEEEEEVTPDEADALLETLSFSSGTKVTGSVPSVVNTSLVKTDSEDTIYTMPGLKIPLRISNPVQTSVKGWYVAVKNSTFFYDVLIDDIEDSDTVTVVVIDFDIPADEAPAIIPVEITPYDQADQPIDIIERIFKVEDPNASTCDLLVDGDTSNFDYPEWLWRWTIVYNPDAIPTFINGQGRVFGQLTHPIGCCNAPNNCPSSVFDPVTKTYKLVYDSEVAAQTYYGIMAEAFSFYKNGTFARFTREYKQNFDPVATDWCARKAEYNIDDSDVYYYGTHNYVPGNSDISYGANRVVCNDPLGICGYGSRPGKISNTCNALAITVDRLALEFTYEVRIYTRSYYSLEWRD